MEACVAIEMTPPPPVEQTVCAVIVTYYPDAGLSSRVERVAKQVSQTVIVDNGSPKACIERIKTIANELGTHLILNSSNEGIACALNAGARWAAFRGYRWVLTLDQDTAVAPDMIDTLSEVFRWYPVPERLAIIGSNYTDKATGRLPCDERTKFKFNGSPGREMISVLTSGSLVSVDAYQVIGGFRDEFFIDCVDHEYCLRARAHGFNVLMTSKPVMEHGIGRLTEHQLLWRRVGTSNHSPIRQYFLARNSLILAREYIGKEPRWILGYLWLWAKLILLVLMFEEERILKMGNFIRGCVDGLLGRTSWRPS
jgi:rhamnosyltransferase